MAIMLDAMFGIIMGMKYGETRRGPRLKSLECSVINVAMPPMPLPM